MPLQDLQQAAELSLTFVAAGSSQYPERLTRNLNPGEVRLVNRNAEADEAVALAPETAGQAREIGAALAKLAKELEAESLHVAATPHATALAGAVAAADWSDRRFKSGEPRAEPSLWIEGLSPTEQAQVEAMSAGLQFARELVSAPGNLINPATLAKEAQGLNRYGVDVEVWDEATITARGMGLLAAVAAGSTTGPRLIRLVLPARGERQRVIALVGKGITFDTGGYSIKNTQGMFGMKTDMGGAAAVLGAVRALAGLKEQVPPGVEVRAYVAAAENMVGPEAMRPGDIYRAANGKTVEIVSTDAEGRLVLGDALAVACDEGASEVVDLATLTGAKVVSLGKDIAALYSTDADLTRRLKAGAEQAGEFVWEMPLHQPYLKAFQKNTIADLKNSDLVPSGGSIKAALFLQQFVTRPWAHLDIAGNAANDEVATGWGVGTLTEYVLGSN